MRVDRQKLKKNCDLTCPGATLSHEMRVDRQKLKKIAILLVLEQPFHTKWGSIVKNWGKSAIFRYFSCAGRSNPFARNEGRSAKTEVKLRFDLCRSNPFARNEGRSAKTEVKLRFDLSWSNPFARNEGRSSKIEEKLRFFVCRSNPFAQNEGRSPKTEEKVRFFDIFRVPEQPFRTKWESIAKNWGKSAIFRYFSCAGATLSHEMRVDRQKLGAILLVPDLSVCKSACV